jgi:hypothetical protein
MAVEPKRGCGYRKVGGTYVVGGGIGVPCDRLPFLLDICPCCGEGFKQGMGWQWMDVGRLFKGPHILPTSELLPAQLCDCATETFCPLCAKPEVLGRAGLIWIGEKFYKTPQDFVREGVAMGFSRRIKAVPHGFEIGKTYIMLAHPKAVRVELPPSEALKKVSPGLTRVFQREEYKPGIFYFWLPQRIEKILTESQRGSDEVAALEKRGIVPVFVPDDDPDHRGSVHDDKKNEDRQRKLLD